MKKRTACIISVFLVLFLTLATILGTNMLNNKLNGETKGTKTEIKTDRIQLADPKTSTITIKNVQNDSEVLYYTYTINIDGVAGVIKYDVNGQSEYLVFDAKGKATINAPSNSTINIYEMPYNTEYVISQNTIKNYKTEVNNTITNEYNGITSDKNIIEFKNISILSANNPNTSDSSIKYTIIALALFIFLYTLKQSKVKKFTN